MDQKTALRIAFALERIADRLELLTLETEPTATEQPECLHAQRIQLGQTNGWKCLLCEHTENPS